MAHWFTIEEAARHLDIAPGELAALMGKGEGPRHFRKGPLVRFAMEDLDVWVETELADQTPENSDGWQEVAGGTIRPASETKRPDPETPDPENLYADEPPVAVPAPDEVVKSLLGPDGRPLDRTQIRIGSRGSFVGVGDWGNEFHAPDPTEGIPPERLAGVGVAPPHVVEQCQEDPNDQRKLFLERMSRPKLP